MTSFLLSKTRASFRLSHPDEKQAVVFLWVYQKNARPGIFYRWHFVFLWFSDLTSKNFVFCCAPSRIRTCDHLLKRQLLYQTELWGRKLNSLHLIFIQCSKNKFYTKNATRLFYYIYGIFSIDKKTTILFGSLFWFSNFILINLKLNHGWQYAR